MALVTRCPNCASAFKVTPQHLQMQEGNVRCGHCLQVFNGFTDLATIQELDIDKPIELSVENEETKKEIQNEILATETPATTYTGEPKSYTFDAIEAPRISRIWALINILLVVVFIGQVIYFNRAELSFFAPSVRPYLEQYCEVLNCKIPPLQQTELLSIESSDMQNGGAKQKGVATLTAMIRNQAIFPQPLPSLELTLTDIQDRALASRIFIPGEYLEENSHLSDTIEPNKEISVTLKIDSGDLNAAGYRLLLLYP